MLSAILFLLEDDFSNHSNNIPTSSEDQFTDMSHVLDCLLNGICIPDVIVGFAKYVCLCVVACILDNIVCNRVRINIVSNYLGQNRICSTGAIFNGTAKKIANPFSAEGTAKLPFIKVVGIWSLAGNVGICVCQLHHPKNRHFCLSPTCHKCWPDTLATFCYVGPYFGCQCRVREFCCRHIFLHVSRNQY